MNKTVVYSKWRYTDGIFSLRNLFRRNLFARYDVKHTRVRGRGGTKGGSEGGWEEGATKAIFAYS